MLILLPGACQTWSSWDETESELFPLDHFSVLRFPLFVDGSKQSAMHVPRQAVLINKYSSVDLKY